MCVQDSMCVGMGRGREGGKELDLYFSVSKLSMDNTQFSRVGQSRNFWGWGTSIHTYSVCKFSEWRAVPSRKQAGSPKTTLPISQDSFVMDQKTTMLRCPEDIQQSLSQSLGDSLRKSPIKGGHGGCSGSQVSALSWSLCPLPTWRRKWIGCLFSLTWHKAKKDVRVHLKRFCRLGQWAAM